MNLGHIRKGHLSVEPKRSSAMAFIEHEDRDPHYDYDHSHAHGENTMRNRFRAMSIGNLTEATSQRPYSQKMQTILDEPEKHRTRRRGSHDEKLSEPREFLVDVEETQRRILQQEDTDGDFQITVTDSGPKVLPLGSLRSHGHKKYDIRGTYALANLLQELALASDHGRRHIVLNEARILENPVDRLTRMIRHHFWDGLTRRIDAEDLEIICLDPKDRTSNHHQPRIYVPYNDREAFDYYKKVAEEKPHLNLDVVSLPKDITPEYVRSINEKPGILALALRRIVDIEGNFQIRGCPFVVPGGRFNEMYGWDSYFEALGLLQDGRGKLAKAMVDNFVYEITHYGKILNANRSYYLTRSQPPFLTDMIIQVYNCLELNASDEERKNNLTWLKDSLQAAIKEYQTVWMKPPRFVENIGLSRYHAEGIGMPPETESTHFDSVLRPFAKKYSVDIQTFTKMYNEGKIKKEDSEELNAYFIHDRSVRESGHDTTYRLEGKCANICPVDLNCLLYKYEVDIGCLIRDKFDDQFESYDGSVETSSKWFICAESRQKLMNEYCWDQDDGLYYDYDIKEGAKNKYESATVYFALWAGIATKEQAELIVRNGLKLFEVQGGLVSGTLESRGPINLERPNRQWDYPYGWAPHQIVAWSGLAKYNYITEARRLSYRWLFTIVKAFVDFNGVVPEKFDVVTLNHRINAEYGNVNTDFRYVPREGFGWMNSSFQVGLTYLTETMRRALGALVHPDQLFHSPAINQTRSSV